MEGQRDLCIEDQAFQSAAIVIRESVNAHAELRHLTVSVRRPRVSGYCCTGAQVSLDTHDNGTDLGDCLKGRSTLIRAGRLDHCRVSGCAMQRKGSDLQLGRRCGPQRLEDQHQEFVSGGAFKFGKYETDQYLQIDRNDNYTGGPKAKLDRIFFKILTADVALAQMDRGELDLMIVPVSEMDRMKKNPNVSVVSVPSPSKPRATPLADQRRKTKDEMR